MMRRQRPVGELLKRKFRDGLALDLSDEPQAYSVVPAADIIRLLTSPRSSGISDKRRIEIVGAEITGVVDFSHINIPCPVIFRDCSFHAGVRMIGAHLRELVITGCDLPTLEADHAEVAGDLDLSWTRKCVRIDLAGASIGNDIHLTGATIERPGQIAVNAGGVMVGGDADCRSLRVTGAVSVQGASIGRSLIFDHADIENDGPSDEDEGKALLADGASVGYEVHAIQVRAKGLLSFVDLRCPASVQFSGSDLTRSNPHNTALALDRAKVGGSIFCDNGFHASGVVRAMAAELGGSLYLNGARLDAPIEGALLLDRAVIKGNVDASRKEEKPIAASGAISMRGARVEATADFSGAKLHVRHGTAIAADRATIGGDMHMHDGFEATGSISLSNAEISGTLTLEASGIRCLNPGGAAADLTEATLGVLHLSGAPQQGMIDLTGTSAKLLRDNPQDYTGSASGRIILNGLTYDAIHASGVNINDRLDWLRAGTMQIRTSDGTYKHPDPGDIPSQPWTELAAAYRRQRSGRQARKVLLQGQREKNRSLRQIRARPLRWFLRTLNAVQDGLIGYGYVPWRALTWIIVLLGGGTIYFYLRPPQSSSAGKVTSFTWVDAVTYAGHLLLPISGATPWRAASVADQIVALMLAAAGWIFSITAIADITRVVRDLPAEVATLQKRRNVITGGDSVHAPQ